jgi:Carboxypeptidase regulatory-like domain
MKALLLLLLLLLTVLSPLVLLTPSLYAQPSSATVHGAVTDESGAVIPGAKVTISNAAGPVKSGTAGDDGNYSITGLAPGQYSVQATSPGLQQIKPFAVDLAASPTATANLQLQVAAEKQEVTVQENPGPAISVDPTQNAGALVLRGADLEALSDDPDDLQADLQALAGPSAGPSGGQIYIDGFTGGELPSKDAIREIRINQNPFSPEYDKLGYGRIEILTKPGTDKLHGNVFGDFGDAIWDARNPYAAKKAPFLQRNFGGSLSSSLGKKASFFLDIQDRDIDNGNIINGYNVGPAPTFTATPFNSVFSAPQNRFRISPRVDYQLSTNNTLTVRYGYTRNNLLDQGAGNLSLLSTGAHNLDTDYQVQLIETAVLSTKVINETHFQLYHTQNNQMANIASPALVVAGAFNGGGSQVGLTTDTENHYELQNYTTVSGGAHTWKFGVRVRAVTINNFSPINFGGTYLFSGGGYGGLQCDVSTLQDCSQLTSIQLYSDTLVLQQQLAQQYTQGTPAEIASQIAAALQAHGLGPSQFSITRGYSLANVNQVDVGAFVGDDWRLKPNFTLSLGLRFETQTNIHDWHDWAPRIGFAWAPGQSKNNPRPKTVFRGGFGIFYDRVSEQDTETAERYGYLQQQYVIPQSALNPIPFTPNPTTGVPDPGLPPGLQLLAPHTLEILDSNLHAPYILQEAITVERQLPKNTTLSESYVNSHGLHELMSNDINAPLPGSLPNPATGLYPASAYPLYSQYQTNPVLLMESSGLFNQWQLITNIRSQLNKRVSLNGFYMYGRAYSNTDGVTTLPANPYSMAGEYGPSALDVRNRVFIGGTILAPWNVLLAPFFTANSGAPYNIITGTDPYGTDLNATLFTARPTIAPDSDAGMTGVVCKKGLPCLDTVPQPGEPVLPRNFGRSPGSVNLNFRIAKTFGFGGTRESTRNQNGGNAGGGPPPGGGGRGGPGGGGFQGGGPGGGPGGFFRGLNGSTGQKYNLTISVQARNILNYVNPGPINGIITSPLFGESNNLAGGVGAFAQSGLNRRLDLQARFTF